MTDVTLANIKEAAERIRQIVPPTPLRRSENLSRLAGQDVYLKLENLNVTGSFKIRGACNAILTLPPEDAKRGVVASSAGNHAQGVAYSCRVAGIKSTIFMPETAPLVKVAATKSMGATVILKGDVYDDAYDAAKAFCDQNGSRFVHPYGDAAVINGQGSVGLEILEQLPNVGTILTSVGGGGLISGLACAVKETKRDVDILGVQAANYPAMEKSFREKRLVSTPPSRTIADGIAVRQPWQINFELISRYVDDMLVVSEQSIMMAIMEIAEKDHTLTEGAGAAGAAAVIELIAKGKHKIKDGRPIVVLVCGGNIDLHLLNRLIPQGLRVSGRLMRIIVRISDRPGRLAELLNTISGVRANLIEVEHNRIFGGPGYDEVEVRLDLETVGADHQQEVCEALQAKRFKFMTME